MSIFCISLLFILVSVLSIIISFCSIFKLSSVCALFFSFSIVMSFWMSVVDHVSLIWLFCILFSMSLDMVFPILTFSFFWIHKIHINISKKDIIMNIVHDVFLSFFWIKGKIVIPHNIINIPVAGLPKQIIPIKIISPHKYWRNFKFISSLERSFYGGMNRQTSTFLRVCCVRRMDRQQLLLYRQQLRLPWDKEINQRAIEVSP